MRTGGLFAYRTPRRLERAGYRYNGAQRADRRDGVRRRRRQSALPPTPQGVRSGSSTAAPGALCAARRAVAGARALWVQGVLAATNRCMVSAGEPVRAAAAPCCAAPLAVPSSSRQDGVGGGVTSPGRSARDKGTALQWGRCRLHVDDVWYRTRRSAAVLVHVFVRFAGSRPNRPRLPTAAPAVGPCGDHDRSDVHGVTLAALSRLWSLQRHPPRIRAVGGRFHAELAAKRWGVVSGVVLSPFFDFLLTF